MSFSGRRSESESGESAISTAEAAGESCSVNSTAGKDLKEGSEAEEDDEDEESKGWWPRALRI